ncbi:MAG: hypothetical protein HY423_08745 [Candidatus Lambdaproteobacteria bacterium]|nr:hypothetical protein [Candidatus Lambdaproteobacteria bacterium]
MTTPVERISRVVETFDGQGVHRTATDVDAASAAWLAEQARSAGLAAGVEPFALERLDLHRAELELEGRRVEGLPLFDWGLTGAEGTRGRLGFLGEVAEIGVVTVGARGAEPALERARTGGPHRAIVAVTVAPQPGLAPRNAEGYLAPAGPPVLQVASAAYEHLQGGLARGAEALLFAHGSRVPAEALNVVARLAGRRKGLAPLVVMTPRSGWWHCAGERGGGIACWCEIMQALRGAAPACDLWFVATSGHELGHLGLEAFLKAHPELPARAQCWVHLGASIGAAREPALTLYTSNDGLESLAVEALERAGADEVAIAARGTMPGGEAREIHARGGRYISVAGQNALFHLPQDRWPQAVNVRAIARYAEAFADMVRQLAAA